MQVTQKSSFKLWLMKLNEREENKERNVPFLFIVSLTLGNPMKILTHLSTSRITFLDCWGKKSKT